MKATPKKRVWAALMQGGCSCKWPIGAECADDDNDGMINSCSGWGWGVWLANQLCMKDDSLTKNLKSGGCGEVLWQ